MVNRFALAATLLVLASTPAFAHLDPVEHGSVMAGFSHPLFGLDHILAMVAVGLWAAATGGRAIWLVPVAFVGTMAIGFAAAIGGVPLPFVEPVILASVIVIGILVALALPIPVPAVAALVAFFALFHGHAHGGELGAAGAIEFAVGFMVSTVVLHGIGVALGLGIGRLALGKRGALVTRVLGGATALGGLWLAFAG
jgi:urease accessory protein